MMKRSPDESFVFTPSKQPRQGPSAGPQSISELARNIPDKRIKAMHAYLQVWVETPDDDIDFASVHGIVQLSLPTRTPPRFVDLTTFEKNIEGQKGQFYDIMRSASHKPLCREELEKLITYGMCHYYETSHYKHEYPDAFWSLPSKSNCMAIIPHSWRVTNGLLTSFTGSRSRGYDDGLSEVAE